MSGDRSPYWTLERSVVVPLVFSPYWTTGGSCKIRNEKYGNVFFFPFSKSYMDSQEKGI